MATISSSIYPISPKPSIIVPQLANYLSIAHTSQSSPIREPQM